MKTTALVFLLGFSILAAGCGPSKAEREAAERERQRLELERQAEADRRKANEAFRKIGENLGRKAPPPIISKPADETARPSSEAPSTTEAKTTEQPKQP
jgi:hypothetical protein